LAAFLATGLGATFFGAGLATFFATGFAAFFATGLTAFFTTFFAIT
jgi:hypothetical protein